MHISERTVGDVVIVDVSGKVTLGDGGDVVLKDKMQSLVQQGRKKVLLNLAEVSYVDSAGLGEIVPVVRDGDEERWGVEAAARDEANQGFAVDHQAPDRLRVLRQRGRGDHQLSGVA